MMTSTLLSPPSAAFTSKKYRYVYWPCIYLVSDRHQTARTLVILTGFKDTTFSYKCGSTLKQDLYRGLKPPQHQHKHNALHRYLGATLNGPVL